jgi:uncharacterized membrane protein YfcA
MWGLLFLFALPCLIAILSGMGMGSGGLLVVYLRLLGGDSQLALQSFNLMFFIFSSGASLAVHLPRRRIYGGALVLMALSGIIGALLGSSAAIALDGDILRKIFGYMLIATGLFSLWRSFGKERSVSAKYDR